MADLGCDHNPDEVLCTGAFDVSRVAFLLILIGVFMPSTQQSIDGHITCALCIRHGPLAPFPICISAASITCSAEAIKIVTPGGAGHGTSG
jgi:hypothetical protein